MCALIRGGRPADNQRPKGRYFLIYIKLFFTAFFWGGTFIAGRAIAQNVGPFSAAFLRFAVASLCLFFLIRKTEADLPPLKRHQYIPVLLLGLTGVFAYNVFFFKGLKLIQAGRASLIIATNPVFIAVLSAYFFKEKINVTKGTGILVSVAGAIIVISKGHPLEIINGHLGWGELFIFFCVASWVTFSLIGKRVVKDLSPLVSIFYAAAIGTAALFPAALVEGIVADLPRYTCRDWIGIGYLGVFGTVIGFVWYYEGIKKIGPMKAGLFINFVPVSAILLAFFILKEPVTLSLLVGAVFVCSGVYLMNSVSAKDKRPRPLEATGTAEIAS
jgi:drug/metabolite transporter (DMT)-like permease